jgi:hypothetical protein
MAGGYQVGRTRGRNRGHFCSLVPHMPVGQIVKVRDAHPEELRDFRREANDEG